MDSESATIAIEQSTVKNAHFEDFLFRKSHDLYFFEKQACDLGYNSIAGVDEAGRGPLAGPVVVAACILPPDCMIEGLNDSKLLTAKKREELFKQLTQRDDLFFSLAILDHQEIDRLNILQATLKGMRLALRRLKKRPDFVLIDGNRAPPLRLPHKTIVDGDKKSASIAAASILAKVTRDRLMVKLDKKYPSWNFLRHKGYGTKEHLERLTQYGVSPIHRKTFAPVRQLLEKAQPCDAYLLEQMDWDMLKSADLG